jgi:DNA-binding response OmpR family regulator
LQPKVLVVEDDVRLGELVVELLGLEGIAAEREGRGDEALRRILASPPALVVLDIGLDGLDGISVCRLARRNGYEGPILMITARGEEHDEILGLEVGADDYLTKPVSPPRLLARVRALLRRRRSESAAAPPEPFRIGPLVVDPRRRSAELHGRLLDLSTAEFDLLHLLVRRKGEVVSRDEILRELRGLEHDGLDRSVDLRISRLRRRLDDDPKNAHWIKTVHGAGYLFLDPQ